MDVPVLGRRTWSDFQDYVMHVDYFVVVKSETVLYNNPKKETVSSCFD